ncbi:MAG: glycosyltransferase family 4 protein [Gemmatimonadetes bacterium]|nr:glycosyltransferase family 4 protein [Gemmatimonadota bacterium]
MDIALVVHNFDPASGTGGYVVELSRRFAREHQVTVYASEWSTTVDGVRMVQVPALRGRAYATIMTFPAAFAAVRKRHDVVHAQGWVTRAADVVTTHIVLDAWRDAARQAGVIAPIGERVLGGFVTARERALVRQARAVIAPSRRAAADIASYYGRTVGVTVIHHGFPGATPLPDRAEARRQLGLPADAFVALYAGDARKGFDAAARAVAGTPSVQLLVASTSASGQYLARAHALGITERVRWAGGLADMRVAFAAADVLLHPTIYDTFAMVVGEALAYGVPVIVSREAGIADLMENGRSGWIVGADDEGTAAALRVARDDQNMRRRLAEAGRAIALHRTWDQVAADTLAVYRSVVDPVT